MDIWLYGLHGGYRDIWVYGYMGYGYMGYKGGIWLYGVIWIYGYLDIWLNELHGGYLNIWLYGYVLYRPGDKRSLFICAPASREFSQELLPIERETQKNCKIGKGT